MDSAVQKARISGFSIYICIQRRKQEIVTITPQIRHLLESVLAVIPRIHKCFSLSNLICVVLADRHNCLVN
jgi:hypothetical protein